MCLKVNLIARLEFERAYFDIASPTRNPQRHRDSPQLLLPVNNNL